MVVLVCGGRDFSDKDILFSALVDLGLDVNSVIVHGGARGADSLAWDFAKIRKIPCRVYHADWKKYGNSAGPIRNQEMIDKEKVDLVLAFKGGRGTNDMIKRSEKKGIKVIKFF